jgi:hypothetical protein
MMKKTVQAFFIFRSLHGSIQPQSPFFFNPRRLGGRWRGAAWGVALF